MSCRSSLPRRSRSRALLCGASARASAATAAGVLLLAASLPARALAGVACTRTYTVQPGDTCDKIGQQTLTSTYQVMALNLPQAGPSCFDLVPGHEICLGRYGSDCQTVYVANAGDTCASIASAYGVSVGLLQQNNPTLDCDIVYAGLVLCTAPGNIAPPTPQGLSSAYLQNGRRALEARAASEEDAERAHAAHRAHAAQRKPLARPAAAAAAAAAPAPAAAGAPAHGSGHRSAQHMHMRMNSH